MLATAIMMAISGSAMAAAPQWVEPSQELIDNKVTVDGGAITSASTIAEDKYVEAGSDSKQNVYATDKDGSLSNTASIWGKATADKTRLALLAGDKNSQITNNGKLYIEGKTTNWWGVAAIKTSGNVTNEGLIYAKDAIGIQATTSANSTITNTGVIVAHGTSSEGFSASAMEATAKGKTTNIKNSGDIYVVGNAVGVRLGDQTGSADGGSSFTNSGSIYANKDAYAIYANNKGEGTKSGITVNLEKGSHVEGLVGMDKDSTLNINGVSGENIALETLGDGTSDGMKVNLVSSNVTIEQGTDSALKIGTLNTDKTSSTNFLLNNLGTDGNEVLDVAKVEGEGAANVNVTYSGAVADKLAADASQKSNLFYGISLGENGANTPSNVDVLEGKYGDSATYVFKDGEVVATNVKVNSLLASTQDLAINSALMWRTQLSSYTDRMSTLRSNPQSSGIWTRYMNGRLDGEGITHDYNTIEIGYDRKVSDLITLGASVSYTLGDADLRAGQADNNTFTAGLYATLNQNNFFVDAMVKLGYIDSDYDISNQSWSEHGDYNMFGAIFGIETGYRFNVNNFFFEPQARLTFSKLSPESYDTNLRSVNFEDIESFVGSLGFISGFNFNDKGSVYAGASYNYDFMGSVNGEFTTDNVVRNFRSELDDSWGEAKIGASYMVIDNLNAYMDLSRDFGADIEQQWRVNLGARYMF